MENKKQNTDILQEGYFLLYKKIIKSGVWSDPLTLKLWIYCLARANFEDNKKVIFGGKVHTLKRGQFITSTEKTANDCDMGVKQVRSRWGGLKSANKLHIKGTNKYSLITVLNYNIYQTRGQAEGQADRQSEDNQRASKGQQKNNINKIIKKNKDFFVFEFLNDIQKQNFDKKPEFAKLKLNDWKKENRILIGYYFLEGVNFESEFKLNCLLKNDRIRHERDLDVICQLEDKEIFKKMSNLSKNNRLSISNLASAINSQLVNNSKQISDLTKELSNKMNMSF